MAHYPSLARFTSVVASVCILSHPATNFPHIFVFICVLTVTHVVHLSVSGLGTKVAATVVSNTVSSTDLYVHVAWANFLIVTILSSARIKSFLSQQKQSINNINRPSLF